MKIEKTGIRDSVAAVLGNLTEKRRGGQFYANGLWRPRAAYEPVGAIGTVTAVLTGPDGLVKQRMQGRNLVTDVGDHFLAARAYDDTYNIVTGMKLGNDSATAVAKNGAGAGMVTYITGSNEALDAAATDATKGAGAGWRTTYVCTWIAGDVTNADIEEVCLTNQTALADNTSAVADTIARHIFPATIDKQAGDSLEVTWQIDILGST